MLEDIEIEKSEDCEKSEAVEQAKDAVQNPGQQPPLLGDDIVLVLLVLVADQIVHDLLDVCQDRRHPHVCAGRLFGVVRGTSEHPIGCLEVEGVTVAVGRQPHRGRPGPTSVVHPRVVVHVVRIVVLHVVGKSGLIVGGETELVFGHTLLVVAVPLIRTCVLPLFQLQPEETKPQFFQAKLGKCTF